MTYQWRNNMDWKPRPIIAKHIKPDPEPTKKVVKKKYDSEYFNKETKSYPIENKHQVGMYGPNAKVYHNEIPSDINRKQKRQVRRTLADYGIKQQNSINLYNANKHFTFVVYGSGMMGKSTLIMHLYDRYFAHDKDRITTLYTHSSHIDKYQNHNNLIIRKNFTEADKALIASHKGINEEGENRYKFLEVFDDIINIRGGIGKGGEDDLVSSLILYYRNSGVSTIISTQYEKLISKQNRSNVHSCAFFGFTNVRVVKELIESYLEPYFKEILGNDATMTEMVELYQIATQDHGGIYLIPHERRIEFFKINI